jgi:hypothetical protein
MKPATLSLVLASATLLAACGGGASLPAAPAPAASKMAPYVGVWAGPCDHHGAATVTITESAPDSVNFTEKIEFFTNADCTGPVLGTINQSAARTVSHRAVVDASVVYAGATAPVTAKVDLVTSSAPAITYSMTGPAVFARTNDGHAEACTDLGNGQHNCASVGTDAPLARRDWAMHVIGNSMHDISASAGGYIVVRTYTRR